MKYPLLFILLSALSVDNVVEEETDSPEEPVDDRIVGGKPAKAGDFPYQVAIRQKDTRAHHCGGSIVDSTHVLTAAHCMFKQKYSNIIWPEKKLDILVGNIDRNQGLRYDILYIFTHDRYNKFTKDYDIALITIIGEFNFSTPYVQPITLVNMTAVTNTSCNVSGWGTVEFGIHDYQILLRYAEILVMDHDDCEFAYNEIESDITPNMICAGALGGGKDSCQGDSGGPLTNNNSLIGIVSFGAGCGDPEFPGIYTDVSKFLSWVDETKIRTSGAHSPKRYFLLLLDFYVIILILIYTTMFLKNVTFIP